MAKSPPSRRKASANKRKKGRKPRISTGGKAPRSIAPFLERLEHVPTISELCRLLENARGEYHEVTYRSTDALKNVIQALDPDLVLKLRDELLALKEDAPKYNLDWKEEYYHIMEQVGDLHLVMEGLVMKDMKDKVVNVLGLFGKIAEGMRVCR